MSVLFALSLASGVAVATDEKSAALAVELFDAGKDLEGRGDFAAACAKFQESAALDVRVGTFARLAQCEEKLGRMLNARMHWARAVDLAEGSQDPRAEHAKREYARVDALVPKLTLVLGGPAPPGLTLAVDDGPVGVGAIGVPVAVAPGAHTIRAAAPGKRPFETTIMARDDGRAIPVQIDLVDAPQVASTATDAVDASMTITPAVPLVAPALEAPPTPLGSSHPSAGPNAWGAQRTLALMTGGLGVVAAGVGSYFGLESFAKWKDAKNQCGASCAPEPATATKVDAQRAATAADVAFGAAAVLLAGAGVLWFTSGPRVATKNAGRVRIVAFAGPASGVLVAGSFGP